MLLYELAYHLKMTVEDICCKMTYRELRGWTEYFNRRPPEWRDDQRTALVVQSFSGSKMKAEELFPSLKPVFDESRNNEEYQKKQIASNSFINMLRKKTDGEFMNFLDE